MKGENRAPMEILGVQRNMGTGKCTPRKPHPGAGGDPTAAELLTADEETIAVQGIGAQPRDPMGLLA